MPTEFWRKNSEHIREWLGSIEKVELPKNNWLFFQLLVHVLLYKLDLSPLDWDRIKGWQKQINEFIGAMEFIATASLAALIIITALPFIFIL
ncbi:MAG: DUF2264 domain-containing protein [Dorea sp.]|nr:DUF2264 domain-containing protein [Dorea sp.]